LSASTAARITPPDAISETVEAIRAAVREASEPFPEFTTGVTGRPALEADEMRTTDRDSTRAEIIALVAVFVGLIVMLRSIWLAVAGEIALGVGMAGPSAGRRCRWGLEPALDRFPAGADRHRDGLPGADPDALPAGGRAPRDAAGGVDRRLSPVAAPINTACLGAAGAFFVAVFTDFRGAAQLGIIAGGGLLLCLLAGYTVLPALLTIFPPHFARKTRIADLGRPRAARNGTCSCHSAGSRC
jgi:uncharacterized membrane protein YdfJ with MMPL/SSD domain